MGKKVRNLRGEGVVPAVLYGPALQPAVLSVAKKEFALVLKEAGESSLVSLEVGQEKTPVLIRGVQRHPVSGDVMHVDFYQPRLDEKIKIMILIRLEGEAPAQKDLEGTLIQNVHEVEVEALPQDLPHEIVADVSVLKTFEDRILVGDLQVSSAVEVIAEPDWIVAQVMPPENVEAELAKSVEEADAVAAVEKVEGKKEDEEGAVQGEESATEEKK